MISNNEKIVGIIQARMGSTRLPKKVLREVKGKPLLQYMLERVSKSKYLNQIVIATTTNPADDIIELFARQTGYPVYRGSESDVLDRFYKTAIQFKADIIVRFCSDCPIIDPAVVDKIIGIFLANKAKIALVCNKMPFTYPDGFDTEVCSLTTLEYVWQRAQSSYDKEHVFTFLYRNPELFPIINVEFEGGDLFHTHRFTLDYEADFHCIKAVIDNLYGNNPLFGLYDILKLTQLKPQILELNKIHLPDKAVRLAIDPGHSPPDNRIKCL